MPVNYSAAALRPICSALLDGDLDKARVVANREFPFVHELPPTTLKVPPGLAASSRRKPRASAATGTSTDRCWSIPSLRPASRSSRAVASPLAAALNVDPTELIVDDADDGGRPKTKGPRR